MSYVLNPYRFAAVDSDYVEATGGTITTEGNYKVHTFLAEGTDFEITNAGTADGSDTFDYLVVAGGGGGGVGDSANYQGGGGGAGGYNYVTGQAAAEQTYSVTIGAGGAGSSAGNARGSNGSNTQLGSFTEMDGGGGGGSFNGDYTSNFAYLSGADGGSGGGSSIAGTGSTDGRGGSANDAAYGNDGGGDGVYRPHSGCGGGGKGAVGNAGPSFYNGGAGGAGEANSISFTSTTYAGGGGGSGSGTAGGSGAGGSGGGGAGGTNTTHSTTGTENSGGGGGGGAAHQTSYDGAAGGKGLIVCRYRTSHDYIEAEGGTVTTSGDYKLHTFTGDGGFAITNAGTASGSNTFDYAVYGGGAGGGTGSGAGGGGGGYRTATGISSSETTVAVTVGAGGAGNTDQLEAGGDGTPSSYAQAGSQEFFDVSTSDHTITTAGTAAYDTTTKKIGNASIAFDGSGDYLSIPSSSDFVFGTSDFTVEAWINLAATSTQYSIAGQADAANGSTGWYFFVQSDKKLRFLSESDGGPWELNLTSTGTLDAADTWYHVAIVRSGDDFTFYLDGAAIGTTTQSHTIGGSGRAMDIGRNNTTYSSGGYPFYLDGYLDQIRISNVARYLTDFTPVEEPFVVDSNTKLLIEPTYTAAGVSTISAGGGGGGGTYGVDEGDGTSLADGSGGGASTYYDDSAEDTYSGAGGTGGSYGNDGGVASVTEGDSGYLYPAGGGGGAGGAGGDASYADYAFYGGDGGIGAKPSWLTNLRGGGGGGGCDYDSTVSTDTGQGGQGYGGGGNGGYADGTGSNAGGDGTANYGAGGGGGSYSYDASTDYDGGDGGSGIVVFRYKYK